MTDSQLIASLRTLLTARKQQSDALRAANPRNPLSGKPWPAPPDPYPAGASDRDFAKFAKRTGIKLPADIRAWLAITNGASGYFGVQSQSGCDIEEMWEHFPSWKSQGWIPIGRDSNGNYFVRPTLESPQSTIVHFVDADDIDALAYAVASDTLRFALFTLEEEEALNNDLDYGWPFNETFVRSKDPQLIALGKRLPWK
jgi:cell wall assembly regulator SMI1